MTLARSIPATLTLLLVSAAPLLAGCPDASVTFEVRGMQKAASGAT